MIFNFAEFKSIISAARNQCQAEAKRVFPCVRSNGCAVVAYREADGYETIYWKGTKRDLLEIVEHFKAQGVDKFTMQGSFDGAESVHALNNFEYESHVDDWGVDFAITDDGLFQVFTLNDEPEAPETFEDVEQARDYVEAKLEHLRETIAFREAAGWTVEQSKAEAEKALKAFNMLAESKGESAQAKALYEQVNHDLVQLNNDYQLEGDLTATANNQLMICPKRYLVTTQGTKLISPAGFHHSQRVFLQTEIAIHTDTLDGPFPDCGKPLVSYNIDREAGA